MAMVEDTYGGFDAPERRLGPANPNGYVEKLRYTDPITLQGKEIPTRDWVVPGWVPWGQVTMLGGDGGVGKSLVAQQLMTSCAIGSKWLGLDVKPCKVFGLFCEDEEDEIHRRQNDINASLGCDFGDLENMAWISYTGGDASLADFRDWQPATRNHFFNQLTETVQKMGAQLVVVDSLHDVFSGNENDRVQARSFVRQLQALAQGIDGAVLLNAHPSLSGMASGTGSSGSTAWNNSVRSRLYMRYQDDEGGEDTRVLANKKANYARRGDEIILDWNDGVLSARESPTGIMASIQGGTCDNVFISLVEAMENEDRPVSENSRAGNYAPRMFGRRPGTDRQGFKQRDFVSAMERLFSSGRIAIKEYVDSTRKPHRKIIVIHQEEMPL